jgi:predicted NUDIX family phosphoesterase
MTEEIEAKITELENRAKRARGWLEYASRAFVLEFAGTPKSGKSTAVEAMRHFFSRNQFRVHVLSERAAVCPIPMKGHLFFNTWCACSMIAELLANVDLDTDIIIVDRGILDALVWLQLQDERGELTSEETKIIESFLLLERWRSLVDLSVVMYVSAEKAMEREVGQRITRKPGSIMNEDVLRAITNSVRGATNRYSSQFKSVISLDTSCTSSVRDANANLAGKIIDHLDEFLNPEVAVIPRSALNSLKLNERGAFGIEAVQDLVACITKHLSFKRRADAEQTSEFVQIVGAGVLVRDDKVFLFRRKEADPKSSLYGKTTLWQGVHVNRDIRGSGLPLVERALVERVTRSLYLSRRFPVQVRGYCWDDSNEHSAKHFGVVFRIEIDNSHTADDLRKKEYRKARGRGHDLVGQFARWADVSSRSAELGLEPWSRSILSNEAAFVGL